MAKPVEAVNAQIRAWRESPAEAVRRLKTCTGAFAQCALSLEETLAALAPRKPWRTPTETRPERQWRWKRKHLVLFWAMTAALPVVAFAAGYLLASGR